MNYFGSLISSEHRMIKEITLHIIWLHIQVAHYKNLQPLCNVDKTLHLAQACILPFSKIEQCIGGMEVLTFILQVLRVIMFCAFSNTICPWLLLSRIVVFYVAQEHFKSKYFIMYIPNGVYSILNPSCKYGECKP